MACPEPVLGERHPWWVGLDGTLDLVPGRGRRLVGGSAGRDASLTREAWARAFDRREKSRRERRCKPNSVGACAPGDHRSGPVLANGLERPTRESNGAGRASSPIWSFSGWGLPCRRCHHLRGELLPRRFTLTGSIAGPGPKAVRSMGQAVCFLWHCPGSRERWALPTTLPWGVRTFLPATGRIRRRAIARASPDEEGKASAGPVECAPQIVRAPALRGPLSPRADRIAPESIRPAVEIPELRADRPSSASSRGSGHPVLRSRSLGGALSAPVHS